MRRTNPIKINGCLKNIENERDKTVPTEKTPGAPAKAGGLVSCGAGGGVGAFVAVGGASNCVEPQY